MQEITKDKKFEQLTKEQQLDAVTNQWSKELAQKLNAKIADAMVAGIQEDRKMLYEKYVSRIDDDTINHDERYNRIAELLSFLRVEYLKYKQSEKTEQDKIDEEIIRKSDSE